VRDPPVALGDLPPSEVLLPGLAVDLDVRTDEREEDTSVGVEPLRHRHPDLERVRDEQGLDPSGGS